MTLETVYQGAENTNTVQFFVSGAAFDFSSVTRMLVTFTESDISADSGVDSTLMDWSTTPGSIIFKFGGLAINPGMYSAEIRIYDSLHPTGQILVDDSGILQFYFSPVAASTIAIQNDDGSVSGANSYVSLAEFLSYQNQRGRSVEYDAQKIKQALIRACDYMDMRFRYVGSKLLARQQTTEWPRYGAYDSDGELVEGVPIEVKNAQCEYAARALVGELSPDPKVDSSGFAISEKSTKIGPMQKTVKYANDPYTTKAEFASYPAADAYLRKFVVSGMIKSLVRA